MKTYFPHFRFNVRKGLNWRRSYIRHQRSVEVIVDLSITGCTSEAYRKRHQVKLCLTFNCDANIPRKPFPKWKWCDWLWKFSIWKEKTWAKRDIGFDQATTLLEVMSLYVLQKDEMGSKNKTTAHKRNGRMFQSLWFCDNKFGGKRGWKLQRKMNYCYITVPFRIKIRTLKYPNQHSKSRTESLLVKNNSG